MHKKSTVSFPHKITPTFYASISHFLVLFGYKMFSLYYPLFLEKKGFNLAVIGSMYMLIYISMAVFSLLVWRIVHRSPCLVKYIIPIGIVGYAAYSVGMITAKTQLHFYIWQLELGLSAALFYIGVRSVIMGHKSRSYDKEFLYFYSAPFYSNFLAPTVGGLILWAFSFREIFVASLFVYLIAITFAYLKWNKISIERIAKHKTSCGSIFDPLKKEGVNVIFLTVAFLAMFSVGIYRGFFVLLLKNEFGMNKSNIVVWIAVTSFISIPISWKLARFVEKRRSEHNLLVGNCISSVMALAVALCFTLPALFFIFLIEYAAKLISESGKSGLITRFFKHDEEGGAVFDTFLTAFGVASGAFIGGMMAGSHGIRTAFLMDSVALCLSLIIAVSFSRKTR